MLKTREQMNDLRKSSVEELLLSNQAKRAELFALRFQAAVGSLEQTHRINALKKEIARIQLVLGEKKTAGANINLAVKSNYNVAVEEADKSGKKVRARRRKMFEDMQNQQMGGVDADALAAAMDNAAADEKPKKEKAAKTDKTAAPAPSKKSKKEVKTDGKK